MGHTRTVESVEVIVGVNVVEIQREQGMFRGRLAWSFWLHHTGTEGPFGFSAHDFTFLNGWDVSSERGMHNQPEIVYRSNIASRKGAMFYYVTFDDGTVILLDEPAAKEWDEMLPAGGKIIENAVPYDPEKSPQRMLRARMFRRRR